MGVGVIYGMYIYHFFSYFKNSFGFFFLYGAVGGGWRTIKEKAAKIYSTS